MLGKTHVVGSLAVAHAGLLIYMNKFKQPETGAEVPELFGVAIGEPLSLVTYGLVMTTVLLFVLLLLRVGNWHTFTAYALVGAMILAGLYFVPQSTYGFQVAALLLAFGLGALLPDIDSETSTIGRYFLPIAKAIPHRTITHTLWAVALVAGIGWWAGSIYVVALAAGYGLHIIQDTFSRQGIAWFYPVLGGYDHFGSGAVMKRGRKPKLAYRTGGTGETALFYASIAVHILCVGAAVGLGFGIV